MSHAKNAAMPSDKPSEDRQNEVKRERLAAALRENLKRRKVQRRGRAEDGNSLAEGQPIPPAEEIG